MKSCKITWAALGLVFGLISSPSHAIYTNGGFEAGNTTGWTTQSYYNYGLSGAGPYTGADVLLSPPHTAADLANYDQQLDPNYVYTWGYSGSMTYADFLANEWNGPGNLKGYMEALHPFRVKVVGAGFTDPQGAPLVFPRVGNHTLMLNNSSYTYSYDTGGGVMQTETYQGAGAQANSIVQSDTIKASDRDVDGKLHVRFSYAVVLDNPGHSEYEQPYFYLRVRNVTKGTDLYEDFAFADPANPNFQPIPAPTSPWNDFLYQDWKDMDIVVPDADLGDVIEVYLLAADCNAGGHSGYAYLDGFGSRTLPPPGQVDSLVPVPTMGEFGLMAMAFGMGALGLGRLRRTRRRSTPV